MRAKTEGPMKGNFVTLLSRIFYLMIYRHMAMCLLTLAGEIGRFFLLEMADTAWHMNVEKHRMSKGQKWRLEAVI